MLYYLGRIRLGGLGKKQKFGVMLNSNPETVSIFADFITAYPQSQPPNDKISHKFCTYPTTGLGVNVGC